MHQIDADNENNPDENKHQKEDSVKQIKFTKKIGRKPKDKKSTETIDSISKQSVGS